MNSNGSKPISWLCGIAAAVLLLVSCENTRPTQPTPTPPPPAPPRSSGPIAFASNRDGMGAIYLANEDGSAVTRLAEGTTPAWSRDGRKIAFARGWDVYVIHIDGSGLQRVSSGANPSWSPDGRAIALDDADSIYAVDTDGSNRRAIFSTSTIIADQPEWSPDGRRIAFNLAEEYDLFHSLGLVTADGSNDQFIVVSLRPAWGPAWSPDGSQIAFVSNSGIGVVGADGKGERPLVAGPFRDVDWTSDGRLIFSRVMTPENFDGPWRIFISDGVERQLIPDATAPARAIYQDCCVTWRR